MSKIFKIFICFSLIVFLISLVAFFLTRNIINIPSFDFLNYMDRGKEYWFGYLNLKQNHKLINLSYTTKYLLDFILLLEFLYICLNERYKDFRDNKEIILFLIIASILDFSQKYFLYNFVYNNKLYMIFLPTLIAAMGILYLSINILKRINLKYL